MSFNLELFFRFSLDLYNLDNFEVHRPVILQNAPQNEFVWFSVWFYSSCVSLAGISPEGVKVSLLIPSWGDQYFLVSFSVCHFIQWLLIHSTCPQFDQCQLLQIRVCVLLTWPHHFGTFGHKISSVRKCKYSACTFPDPALDSCHFSPPRRRPRSTLIKNGT